MGRVKGLFLPRTSRRVESGQHLRKGGIHGGSKKYLQCNPTPTRITPLGNRKIEHYCIGNADA